MADLLSVFLSVPSDIISQRLQLQSSREGVGSIGGVQTPTDRLSGVQTPTDRLSGVQIARKIMRSEGVAGLWRGAGVSLACYLPHSAVWWLTHEKAKVRPRG